MNARNRRYRGARRPRGWWRGRRQPPQFYVGDNANQWPDNTAAIGTVQTEIGISVTSNDLQTNARLQTIEKARGFNRLLALFPFNLLAGLFGIRRWRYSGGRSNRSPRRGTRRSRP
jgi:hypothetical protein